MTNNEAAYIAGIVDGEAYVGISKQKDKGPRGFRYRARVQIEMTNGDLVRWIKKTTGLGSIRPKRQRKSHWKPQFSFVVGGKDMIQFLTAIIKFLRIKKQQALTVIAFQSDMRKPGIKGHDIVTKRFQDTSYQEIKRLNKRGR